ncbi:uncharacterized protein LOC127874400 isoform X2 [Dreissena polymorpha]|nr:uncharacterized protein LOC127874400 isoform X2 [Dreissena polymorpha]XP_052274671.1 uncharacterized protein LOC127874400 isoform X2 [Dreissena polymorpha]
MLMNILGYSQKQREARVEAYSLTAIHQCNDKEDCIGTGSKIEGVAGRLESDFDVMYVPTNVICIESGTVDAKEFSSKTILRIDTAYSAQAYCRLKKEIVRAHCPEAIVKSLTPDGHGNDLLSSDLYYEHTKRDAQIAGGVFKPRSGPACPVTDGTLDYDYVHALRCHIPSLLRQWAERYRLWPPDNIVQMIESMGGFVTPVGFKESTFTHLEWRICFSSGETELMHNLNDTQLKLYVLLKMIVKHVLNPQKKEITSYMVKNLILHLAENNEQKLFHEQNLLHWLKAALSKLKTAISDKRLSSYMIPMRNLMACSRLEASQQRTWIKTIKDMISEGPRIILRLQKLRTAIICFGEPLLWYTKLKLELELLELYFCRRLFELEYENSSKESDTVIREILRRKNEILRDVQRCLRNEGSRRECWNDLHKIAKSMLD